MVDGSAGTSGFRSGFGFRDRNRLGVFEFCFGFGSWFFGFRLGFGLCINPERFFGSAKFGFFRVIQAFKIFFLGFVKKKKFGFSGLEI